MTSQAADAMSTETRLIFANELVPGSVIVQECEIGKISGRVLCEVDATVHGVPHVLTVQRLRYGMGASAIVSNEDGVEQFWSKGGNGVVAVTVASPTCLRSDEDVQPLQGVDDDGQAIRALPWWKKALGYAAIAATFLVPFILGGAVVGIIVLANHLGTR